MEAKVTTAPAGALEIPDQIARDGGGATASVTTFDLVIDLADVMAESIRIHRQFWDEIGRLANVQPIPGRAAAIFNMRFTPAPEKVLNIDPDPEIGELFEVDDHWLRRVGQPQQRFLRVTCGTGRKFVLSVPPWVETALEAQAWTWGLDEGVFTRPEVRT